MGRDKRKAPGSLLSGLPASVLNDLRGQSDNTARDPSPKLKRPASSLSHSQTSRTVKRRKFEGLLGDGWERYDATGLVPFYEREEDVPEHLKKYFYQRERYFSLYHQGCLLDEEGWYSVTPEAIANVIAERCRCDTVLDAFCGVGGNAIAFAQTCERVIAIDNSEVRLRLARHNATIYGVQDRIEFILGDFISFAHAYTSLPKRAQTNIEVVFLSPPWGGINYMSREHEGVDADSQEDHSYDLDRITPLKGSELFHLTRRITPNVAFYLPRHVNLDQVSQLVLQSKMTKNTEGEMIEVQEAWTGNKLKAITCYFGGLVEGQEHLGEI